MFMVLLFFIEKLSFYKLLNSKLLEIEINRRCFCFNL